MVANLGTPNPPNLLGLIYHIVNRFILLFIYRFFSTVVFLVSFLVLCSYLSDFIFGLLLSLSNPQKQLKIEGFTTFIYCVIG